MSELGITAGASPCGPEGIACKPVCLICQVCFEVNIGVFKSGRGTLATDVSYSGEKEVAWQGFCLRVLLFEARVLVQVVLCQKSAAN